MSEIKEMVRVKPLAVDRPDQDVVVSVHNGSIHIVANMATDNPVGWAYTEQQAIEVIWGLIHAVEEARKAA